jgi:hypothetical protein
MLSHQSKLVRKMLAVALALLVAGPAAADVGVTGPADALTFTLTSKSHVLTGEIVSLRGQRERLILDITTIARETLGEKGIQGTIEIAARAADQQMPILYSLRAPGRAASLDGNGFVAIDRDDCCTFHRAYYEVGTGERLFEATTAPAALTLEGPSYKWRVAAYVAAMDGRDDHRAWGETAAGEISYVASDRVIRRVRIMARDAATARRLRSLDDERVALAWIDGRTGAPIVTVPERGPVQPMLRLHFITSGIEVRIPLKDDDLALAGAPAGLTLAAQPQLEIAGGWRIATAVAAPWVSGSTSGAPPPQLKVNSGYVLFMPDRVRSTDGVLDCDKATYEPYSTPPEGLFLGAGLTQQQAASLGLSAPDSRSITLDCNGIYTLHRSPDGRWLFALSNVIYALERAVE